MLESGLPGCLGATEEDVEKWRRAEEHDPWHSQTSSVAP